MSEFKRLLGTGCYSGLSPVAPGTMGSIAVLIPAWFVVTSAGPAHLALFFILTLMAGYYSAPWFVAKFGEDPGQFVMDEWSGQLIPLFLLHIPMFWVADSANQTVLAAIHSGWPAFGLPVYFLASFITFRFFDILKPLGIDQLQSIPGATGIIIDDILAGFYTFTTLFFVILTLL
jgi:phosphatidylglycerophosphatase A